MAASKTRGALAGTAGSACYDTLTATRGNIKRTPGHSQPQKHAFEKSPHAKPEQGIKMIELQNEATPSTTASEEALEESPPKTDKEVRRLRLEEPEVFSPLLDEMDRLEAAARRHWRMMPPIGCLEGLLLLLMPPRREIPFVC